MSAARFEIVRTDAGWHTRFRAANGRVVMTSEVYTRKHNAHKGIEIITGNDLRKAILTGRIKALTGLGFLEVVDVDERVTP